MKTACQDPGEFDQLWAFQSRDESALSADNEPVATWPAYASVFCAALPVGGREFFQGYQVQAQVSLILRCWSDPTTQGITAKMRATYDGRTLEVVASYDRQGAAVREIQCKEAA